MIKNIAFWSAIFVMITGIGGLATFAFMLIASMGDDGDDDYERHSIHNGERNADSDVRIGNDR